MLTLKQTELLNFLIKNIEMTGTSPSYDEICISLKLKSKSGIHRIVHGLRERGYITKLNNKARSLFPKKYPNGKKYLNEEISKKFDSLNKINEVITLPILGNIAAGQPMEAISDFNESIDIPISLIGNGQHYALRVQGDSMIEAGINEHDIAIINSEKIPNNSDIVVALIDDEDVTLKRFRKNGKSIALEPANKEYKTHIYGPNRVKIQGVLTSLLRYYS